MVPLPWQEHTELRSNTSKHRNSNALSEGTKIPVSQRAAIIAHENTLAKLTEIGKIADYLPTDTFFGVSKQVRFNDEPVDIVYAPNAHTTGDVLVYNDPRSARRRWDQRDSGS